MRVDRGSLLDLMIGWFASLRENLRGLLTLQFFDSDSRVAGADADFDGWVANDPMVTLNPASRYGDDATGFLADSELDNPELGKPED